MFVELAGNDNAAHHQSRLNPYPVRFWRDLEPPLSADGANVRYWRNADQAPGPEPAQSGPLEIEISLS
jgi:hypothetical protein